MRTQHLGATKTATRITARHNQMPGMTTMVAAQETTEKKAKQRATPQPLQAVIEPENWYWTSDVAAQFEMSRTTVAELKRTFPKHVGRSRRGDILQGIAVIKWLTGERKPAAS